MRKIILISAFLLSFILSNAQARLGYSYQQIRREFAGYTMNTGYNKQNIFYLEVALKGCTAVYGFDKNLTCVSTVIGPDNNYWLNTYVQKYNDEYVIISAREWRMYSNAGILRIELLYLNTGEPYFLWTKL